MRPLERISRAREIAAEDGLSPTDAHVLLVLCTYADDAGAAWPSVNRLCADCRRGRSVVLAALAELERRRLIRTDRQRRGTAIRHVLLSAKRSEPPDVLTAKRFEPPDVLTAKRSDPPDVLTAKRSDQPDLGVRPTGPREVRPTGPRIENSQAEHPEEGAAAARAASAEILDDIEAQLRCLGAVDRCDLAALLDRNSGKDFGAAVTELGQWAKREQIRSVLAAYGRVLGAQPEPPAPTAAPTRASRDAWAAARQRLGELVPPDTYDTWLAPLVLVGQEHDQIIIGGPPEIVGWVRDRFAGVLTKGFDGQAFRLVADHEADHEAAAWRPSAAAKPARQPKPWDGALRGMLEERNRRS